MSAVAAPPPRIGERERLSATVVLSLLLHGLLILGIGFALDSAAPVMPTLDVILSQARNALTPEQADFLAQANNQGGGEDDKAVRPRDSQTGDLARPEPGLAPRELRAQSPSPAPPPEARVVSSTAGQSSVPQPESVPEAATTPLPRGDRHVPQDVAMARLAAEIHANTRLYARRPSRKFVSASTREYAWAAYLRTWVDRVERVGNLNYPDEARRRGLSGSLELEVALGAAGTVRDLQVRRGSGNRLLDDAAKKIVYMAVPFPPFPEDLKREVDVLRFAFVWEFGDGVARSSVRAAGPAR